LAASVALVGVAWLIGGNSHLKAELPPDPLLESVIQCNIALAQDSTNSAETKLNSLRQLANQLREQMNVIAMVDERGDSLASLAELYSKIVRRGIVEQASDLGVEQQALLRSLVADLVQAELDAKGKLGVVPQSAKKSFEKVAEAAKEGVAGIRKVVAGNRGFLPEQSS
jgi:hypothetical protein